MERGATHLSCSIMIPVYNGRDFIQGAVESALAQGDIVDEVVVIDNCSTDGTWELLQTLDFPKLKIHQNPSNLGLFGNFNQCLKLARSPLALTLCADDRLYPGSLQPMVHMIVEHPGLVLVNAAGHAVDRKGVFIKTIGCAIRPGIFRGAEAIERLYLEHSRTGINPFNYPSGILLNMTRLRGKLMFDTNFKKCGDIDFYYRSLRWGDLAVMDHPACRVTFHSHQEGRSRAGEPIELQEYLRVLNGIRDCLRPSAVREIQLNFRAIGFWRGLQFLAQRQLSGFQRHLKYALTGGSMILVGFRFCLFLARRIRKIGL